MRRRILLLVVGLMVLVVLAFAVPLAFLIRSTVTQQAQTRAIAQADTVARYLRNGPSDLDAVQAYLNELPQTREDSTSVILSDGTVLGTAPPVALPTTVIPGRVGVPPGYPRGPGGPGVEAQVTSVAGGRVVTQPAGYDGDLAFVQVWISDSSLRGGVTGWYLLLAAGSATLLIIGVLAGELSTRRIVRPLTRTAETANRLSSGDVTARAPTDGPREVAAVGTSLNRLADRIDELIAEERETVADLSHRMRTPLTALRLDAEALSDQGEADRIGGHVTALERTLTAVIRAARRPQREGFAPASDATEVVGERVLFWSALTDEQDRRSAVSLPSGPLPVRAAAEDLAAAVDALLENVIAHTPEGTPFSVRLAPAEYGASLEVSDDGPGLPEDAGIRGRSDRGSSGLGLDIARRCAEASGGSITFAASAAGGARIRLDLGAP